MKITWFGQACFEIVTGNGTVIICDPYDPSTGYAANPRRADIVTPRPDLEQERSHSTRADGGLVCA